MDSFRLDRHFKLWEEYNRLIKRVVFLTVVLALAVLIKVLVPFVEHSEDKKPVLQKIAALEAEESEVNKKLEKILAIERVLEEVNRFIMVQPWQGKKEELILRYQRMREGHSREEYQREADTTIKHIADMLREKVVKPIRQGSGVADARGRDIGRMHANIESLDDFVEEWQGRYIGRNWYATINMKELTMSDLSRELNQQLKRFSEFVSEELKAVSREKKTVNQDLQSLNSQIKSEGSRLDDIEKELQSILPQWIRGLIDTNQVIQLMPVLLMFSAGYVFLLGLSLSHHYRSYVTGNNLTEDITSEPAMSSTWTLIQRGKLGTAFTLLAYSLFFITVWVLFEKSMGLLLDWLAIDSSRAWIGQQGIWSGFLWISRFVFLVFIAYVCTMPWRLKGIRSLK